MIQLLNDDCREKLKQLEDNSVDAILTDAPYEIGFMGKSWDNTGIAYDTSVWAEALRVAKPGAILLAFGGTRTHHRMTCAIEDSGWIIKDEICWMYGSGMPKNLNISKAIDKKFGAENVGTVPPSTIPITAPSTDLAKQWDGWHSPNVKPSHEPIIMAQKPLSEKGFAENVLKWGTGGINVDGCRVGTEEIRNNLHVPNNNMKFAKTDKTIELNSFTINSGRYPANVITDGSDEVLEDFAQYGESKGTPPHIGKSKENNNIKFNASDIINYTGYDDTGTPARYFMQCPINETDYSPFYYCSKVSTTERGISQHPTMKPIKLLKYLITLITPPGGTVLDMFMGSGSTGVAASMLDREFIGIELDYHYYQIATQRIIEANIIEKK